MRLQGAVENVSEMTGSSGRRSMTDREIAEDLLAGQKYLSNYYYAPAILEAGDPGLRSAFQEVHAGATTAAKSVFDYLHSKGWYQVRKADDQAISDLRNAVTESRQVVDINVKRGGNNVSMNQGPGGWTGTQSMEGQSGMGPSSVSQGARRGPGEVVGARAALVPSRYPAGAGPVPSTVRARADTDLPASVREPGGAENRAGCRAAVDNSSRHTGRATSRRGPVEASEARAVSVRSRDSAVPSRGSAVAGPVPSTARDKADMAPPA